MLIGSIDDADRLRLRGWVRSSVRPDSPVCLLVTADDRLLERVVANRHRPDLEQAGIGNGRFGFEVAFSPPLPPIRSWLVHVRAEETGEDMPGSPFRLDPASDFDAAAQAAVAMMLLTFDDDAEAERRHTFLLDQVERLSQVRTDRRASRVTESARALVLDAHVPDPDRDGGSVAIVSHMRALRRLGYQVTFAAQTMATDAAPALDQAGIALCRHPEFGSVEEVLRREAGRYDLVYLHRLPIASSYGALARHYQPRARLVYNVADLHHLRLARQAAYENRPELMPAIRRIRQDEFIAARAADAVITHSSVEAGMLRQVMPDERVHVVTWSIPCRRRSTDFEQRHDLAFVGNYGHAPNLAAVHRLRDRIMPRVRVVDVGIRCLLVGDNLPGALHGPDYQGRLEDLDGLFERIRLTVAPLDFGAGLKAKVVQSLAAGVPCVCSPVAAEGLDLPGDLAGLVAGDDAAMTSIILRLHHDAAFNDHFSALAIAFARDRYSEPVLDASLTRATR